MGRKYKYDWELLRKAKAGNWVNYGKGDRNSMQVSAKVWAKKNQLDVTVYSRYDKQKNVLIAIFAS
jgi:hypothetical protein